MDVVSTANASSSEEEHIAAVQDNPFIRNFGIENVIQHRQEAKEANLRDDKVEKEEITGENDQEQEYHVNSGFVNKLRSKFAELESRRSSVISISRRSASVENLLSLTSHSSSDRARRGSSSAQGSADDSKIKSSSELSKVELRKKPSPSSNKSSKERLRSSEAKPDKPPYIKPPIIPKTSKNKNIDFSRPNHIMRSVKPPIIKKSTAEILIKQNSVSSSKRIEHHDWKIAPDLEKIATDNIVIIETTRPTSPPLNKETNSQRDENNTCSYMHTRLFKDKTNEENKIDNELPKPNTVSAFLSIFERGQKLPRPIQAWRQNLSPTRKGSGSDTSSPCTTSPSVTPRSPLTKRLEDNVFNYAQTKTEDSNEKMNIDTKDSSTDAVTKSKDLQKDNNSNFGKKDTNTDTSLFHSAKKPSLVRANSSEKELEKIHSSINENCSSVHLSASLPVSPLSLLFDSRSIAPVPKRNEKKQKVPKDTLALKYDKEQQDRKSPDAGAQTLALSPKVTKKTDFIEKNTANNENVSLDSHIKLSQRKAKISPRQTKIFDSSNMVKVNKEPPKIPTRNLSQASKENALKQKDVTLEIKDKENKASVAGSKQNMESVASVSKPPRLSQNKTKIAFDKISNNSVTEVNKSLNTTKSHIFTKDLASSEKSQELEKPNQMLVDSSEEQPVSGISSFVANRLKKSQEQSNGQIKSSAVLSPVPCKRQAPGIPTSSVPNEIEMTESLPPPLPSTPEPLLPKTNIDDIIKRRNKTSKPMPKMVFDSSKMANKRKDPPKRKPPRKTLEEINKNHTQEVVPKLDLSSITNDTNETEYQEGYIPTIIKPCPFKFVGADVIPEKSPYKKTKKGKVQVHIIIAPPPPPHPVRLSDLPSTFEVFIMPQRD